ncbi:hypothetical protein DRP98_03475 [candidate division KSB1 bacterium]|nr:MAG: hypothetical protein DRQ12_03645 [candidate division KSB1 bacterium]RKY85161.1 MAG: hypothetical protein DRP98_03475 [candidate division KSB1 bacterium]
MAYFIDASKCSGCGACLDVCPQGAIYMVNHTAMIDSVRCKSCGKCVEVCPQHAIQWQQVPVIETTPETSRQVPMYLSTFNLRPRSRGRHGKRFGARGRQRWQNGY